MRNPNFKLIDALLSGDPKHDRSMETGHAGIAQALDHKFRNNEELSTIEWTYFRVHLPYCVEPANGVLAGRQLWQFHNRDYYPLGLPKGTNHKHHQHRDFHLLRDPSELTDLWCGQVCWLYRDDSDTKRDYIKRLGRLLSYVEWREPLVEPMAPSFSNTAAHGQFTERSLQP